MSKNALHGSISDGPFRSNSMRIPGGLFDHDDCHDFIEFIDGVRRARTNSYAGLATNLMEEHPEKFETWVKSIGKEEEYLRWKTLKRLGVK